MLEDDAMDHNDVEIIPGYMTRLKDTMDSFFSEKENENKLKKLIALLKECNTNKKTIYIIGNGGSSAIAEHAAIDFTKNAGLRAVSFSGIPLLTTYANDFGYENMFLKCIENHGLEDDVIIAISGSGTSANIINACKKAIEMRMKIVTLTGFERDNPLRKIGDINFWVNSKAFGYLEIIHGIILHYANDSIVGNEIYMIR